MQHFIDYSDVIFDAFCLHNKRKELIERKKEIIDQVTDYYNLQPTSFLFVGFNPAILATTAKEIYVAEVSDRVLAWLHDQGVNAIYLTEPKQFDLVIAFDEYLTFTDSEEDQKHAIADFCKMCKGVAITTVKDYKNQDFKDREYSQPAIIKANGMVTAFTEIHNWSMIEKNAWETIVYQLNGINSLCRGQFTRRALFFKQLAKFSIDSGGKNFLIHKNIMYKSIIKKNYEHVISIQFQ